MIESTIFYYVSKSNGLRYVLLRFLIAWDSPVHKFKILLIIDLELKICETLTIVLSIQQYSILSSKYIECYN